MNRLRRITAVILAAIAAGPSTSHALGLRAEAGYLLDNTVFDRQSYGLSVDRIVTPGGEMNAGAAFQHARMRSPFAGLSSYQDDFATATAGWKLRASALTAALSLSGGWGPGTDSPRFFAAGEAPLRLDLPIPGTRLLAAIGYRYGVADDNPGARRIGLTKRTASAQAGVGVRYWEVHAGYQYNWYAPVRREQYRELLEDTTFFTVFYDMLNPALHLVDAQTDPLPSCEIHQGSLYFFGPALPFLYLGGSFTYRDATTDLYLPLADTDSGKIIYAFFPYETPHHHVTIGLIAALSRHRDGVASPMNDLSLKLTLPLYSCGSYRGYYQPPSGNLLAGFKDFYYDYYGTGILTLEAEAAKQLPAGFSIGLSYSWVSQPYVAYRFVGKDSYQYHTFKATVGKEW